MRHGPLAMAKDSSLPAERAALPDSPVYVGEVIACRFKTEGGEGYLVDVDLTNSDGESVSVKNVFVPAHAYTNLDVLDTAIEEAIRAEYRKKIASSFVGHQTRSKP